MYSWMPESGNNPKKVMPNFERSFSLSDYLEKMDKSGIETALLSSSKKHGKVDEQDDLSSVLKLKQIIEKYHGRFAGLVGAGEGSAEELDLITTSVREYGFKGVNLSTQYFSKPPNDSQYYPIYQKCVDLDIPVLIKVGAVWQPDMHSTDCHPLCLEDIAIDFPELKIVGNHIGWPWTDEMLLLAWKFKNVYIATSNHYPKSNWAGDFPTAAWDPSFIDFINNGRGCTAYLDQNQPWYGMDKVIFASTFPAFDPSIMIDEMKTVLSEKAFANICRHNSKKLFKL
jgi:uncharacterized protein